MVVVTTIEVTSETTARADVSYHVAPLWGAWYSCDLERVGQLWTARKCRMTGVSYDPMADAAWNRLMDDWTTTRTEVRGHFEALVLREET